MIDTSSIDGFIRLCIDGAILIGIGYNTVQGYVSRRAIKKIEVATDGMKTALVAATAKASYLEGAADTVAKVTGDAPTPPVNPAPLILTDKL